MTSGGELRQQFYKIKDKDRQEKIRFEWADTIYDMSKARHL